MAEKKEKKEPIPSAALKTQVEAIMAQPIADNEKLKVLLRLYRQQQTMNTRSKSNMEYLRNLIIELSGGRFETIAASLFTQGYCTESALYLQGDRALEVYDELEKLFREIEPSATKRRKFFRIVKVPFLKIDWEQMKAVTDKKKASRAYDKARKLVGTYFSLTVSPLTKKARTGK